MSDNKAWNWSANKSEIWEIPSEESYYLVERWKRKNYDIFLDLGCGLGRHSIQFAKNGFSTFSYDLSPEGITHLRERAKMEHCLVRASVGDMATLPYDNSFFDCLLAYHVISHTDTNGIIKVVSEMERVLKPGGEVFLSLCSKKAWSYKDAGFPVIDENTVEKVEDGPENGIPHFFADREIIDRLFTGFEIDTLRHTQDLIVKGKYYGSWHYFILGIKKK